MVRIFCRLWYNCGQTKNHRQNGGDFSQNGGPKGIRTLDLSDANRTLSQLSYGPISPLFAGFCNKKQIFKFFDFRRFRRKFSPKSWAETRRSMCDHRDANRTLSQLSYGPISPLFAGFCNKKQIFKFFDFRRFRRKFSPKSWAETRRSMCDHRDANRTLSQLSYKPITYHIIIHIPRQNARGFPYLFSRAFRSANVPYYFFVFHLCRFCGILRCPAEVRRSLTRQATDTIYITK